MYIDKKGGFKVYEKLDELLEENINFFTEYEDNYYIQLKVNNPWDEGTVWVANKKTEQVSYFGGFVDYIVANLTTKATPVNIEKFLRERKLRSA
ncbi:MAG: hypothetical protein NC078_05055 [Ruminococcus sp.]|nr:hypothetical protein [Ruminococcus sp.]